VKLSFIISATIAVLIMALQSHLLPLSNPQQSAQAIYLEPYIMEAWVSF